MWNTQFECECISSFVQKVLILGTITILSGNKFHWRMARGKNVLALVEMVKNLVDDLLSLLLIFGGILKSYQIQLYCW